MWRDFVKDPRIYDIVASAGFERPVCELADYLQARGHAQHTVRFYQQAAVHFAFWLARHRIGPSHVTHQHEPRFLARHLTRCGCPFGGVRQHQTVRAGVRHFRRILDLGGHRPPQQKAIDAIGREVQRFDTYLKTTCGLHEHTRVYRQRYVREFLRARFGNGRVDVSRIAPDDLIRYLSIQAARRAPASAGVLASSLRSYFRFLHVHGECDERLSSAIPAPAVWKQAALPKTLTSLEIDRFLAAFPRRTTTGHRDYAIARCVVDLGLRAGEVARLRLDDIDWRGGILRIAGSKSRRDDVLPLTSGVATAISTYLRRGRGHSSIRMCSFAPGLLLERR